MRRIFTPALIFALLIAVGKDGIASDILKLNKSVDRQPNVSVKAPDITAPGAALPMGLAAGSKTLQLPPDLKLNGDFLRATVAPQSTPIIAPAFDEPKKPTPVPKGLAFNRELIDRCKALDADALTRATCCATPEDSSCRMPEPASGQK